MNITAKWIWREQPEYNLYNQTVVFRRGFRLDKTVKRAELAITADSFYRLFINGHWINDGPARSYPEHYSYDLLDLTPYLNAGENEIRVIARYFGCGTFHQLCQHEGLLAQLEFDFTDNTGMTLISDGSWEVSAAPQWPAAVPRISIQQEGAEFYDARLETEMNFVPAAELFPVVEAPWQGLRPRESKPLTRKVWSFRKFVSAEIVKITGMEISVPVQRILYPGLINANNNVSQASGIAGIINNLTLDGLRISSSDYRITVNGKPGNDGWFELKPGRNFLLALNRSVFSHGPEKSLFFEQADGFELLSPIAENTAGPCFLRFPEAMEIGDDRVSRQFRPQLERLRKKVEQLYARLTRQAVSEETFAEYLRDYAEPVPDACVLPTDFFTPLKRQQTIADAGGLIEAPENLIYDISGDTVINPSSEGDVRLVYDLGRQNIGYYDFELVAAAGTLIDILEVEHFYRDGQAQHTYDCINGMRYLCKSGLNRFTSLKRRSGRYLLITIRNQSSPVAVRKFQLIESTYPVEYKGDFRCSDDFMNRLWEISVHTLKLCMEDTFTDCPLYEQTLWVGDARNESLFAYTAFGAWDLSRRCLRITAEALEHLPLAGCQVPSAWDTIIPVWSFLWEISVWEYYFETGDRDFLRQLWPAMVKNLEEAERRIDPRSGLFSSPTWNLFDWSGSDINHRTVLHDSMFLAGALAAAERCAEVLGKRNLRTKWSELRCALRKAINGYWDRELQAWPDALDDEKLKPVSGISVHNCFLSLLYDIADERNRESALSNMISPPGNMIKIGSPFAIQFLYETFEKTGHQDLIIDSFYSAYKPMLKENATTVWEVFANSLPAYNPSRSHCHAWSSSPVWFLNRLILGIKMLEPGAGAFAISPLVSRCDWAEGARATVHGPVKVFWEKAGDTVNIAASGPENVKLNYIPNSSHDKLKVIFNGRQVKKN
ncbi:MAG: alpha-L-rhamnosidase N-terminal domain-containing protein [Victivallales bacterium]|nr:alpha-L-rhamnosidase N-terminal domain-containing protein [Victivallales bacterium]